MKMNSAKRLKLTVGLLACMIGSPICTMTLKAADAKPPAKPVAPTKPLRKPSDPPTTGPTTSPFSNPKEAALLIKTAIDSLTKEYQAFKKDPQAKLRTKSDFFASGSAARPSHADILNAISKSVAGDPGADLYIKWQLLSGIDSAVDIALVPQLARVYQSAPAPSMHPGLDPSTRRALDSAIARAKSGDLEQLNSALNKQVAAHKEANAIILDYRDMLAARMPVCAVGVQVGLADGILRVSNGIDASGHMKVVRGKILQCAAAASAPELRAIIADLKNLHSKMGTQGNPKYAVNFPPAVYTGADMDTKTKRAKWESAPASFIGPATLKGDIEQLEQMAAMTGNSKSK